MNEKATNSTSERMSVVLKRDLMRAARKKLGLSQRDVANRARISKTTVAKAEKGDSVALHTWKQLANILEIDPHQLLSPLDRYEIEQSGAYDLDQTMQSQAEMDTRSEKFEFGLLTNFLDELGTDEKRILIWMIDNPGSGLNAMVENLNIETKLARLIIQLVHTRLESYPGAAK